MSVLLFLPWLFFLTLIYYLGYFGLAIASGLTDKHYFLGFGSRPLFRFNVKSTRFSVGIFIPLYGLARFYKMEDGIKKKPDLPWQFIEKPLWLKWLVTYGGVLSLFTSAIAIFAVMIFLTPVEFVTKEELNKYGIYPSALAKQNGFRSGDKITAINGYNFEAYQELLDPKNLTVGNLFTVLRDGQEVIIKITDSGSDMLTDDPFLQIMSPLVIDAIVPGSPAEKTDLHEGDHITYVNGRKIERRFHMQEEFVTDPDGVVELKVERLENNDTIKFIRFVVLTADKTIGVHMREAIRYTIKQNAFGQSVVSGAKAAFSNLFRQFSLMLGVIPTASVQGGPIRMSSVMEEQGNWRIFWKMGGAGAIYFVFWNFIPYPRSVLWETISLIYEGVSGKRYPHATFKKTRVLGWVIFISLSLWILISDIVKILS
jgi:regulator of sigma E protease